MELLDTLSSAALAFLIVGGLLQLCLQLTDRWTKDDGNDDGYLPGDPRLHRPWWRHLIGAALWAIMGVVIFGGLAALCGPHQSPPPAPYHYAPDPQSAVG
jgi:hypothetical protein